MSQEPLIEGSFKSFQFLMIGRVLSAAFLFAQSLLQISICNDGSKAELVKYLVIIGTLISFGRLGAEFHYPRLLFQEKSKVKKNSQKFINVTLMLSVLQCIVAIVIFLISNKFSITVLISILVIIFFQNALLAQTEIVRALRGQTVANSLILLNSCIQFVLLLTLMISRENSNNPPALILAIQSLAYLFSYLLSIRLSGIYYKLESICKTSYKFEILACFKHYTITLSAAARANVDLIIVIHVLNPKETVIYYVITRFAKIFQVFRSQLSSYLYPFFASNRNLSTKRKIYLDWRNKEIIISFFIAVSCIVFLNIPYGKKHFNAGDLLPQIIFFSAFVIQSLVGQAQTFLIFDGRGNYLSLCLILPTILFVVLTLILNNINIIYFCNCYLVMSICEVLLTALVTKYFIFKKEVL